MAPHDEKRAALRAAHAVHPHPAAVARCLTNNVLEGIVVAS